MVDIAKAPKRRIFSRVLTAVVSILAALNGIILVLSYCLPFDFSPNDPPMSFSSSGSPFVIYKRYYRKESPANHPANLRFEKAMLGCGNGKLSIKRCSGAGNLFAVDRSYRQTMHQVVPGLLTINVLQGPSFHGQFTTIKIPLAGTLAVLTLFLVSLIGERQWRARRYDKTACPACGYDLSFNTSGTCPECGRKLAASAKS